MSRFTKVSKYRSGEPKFGGKVGKSYGSGPVITYRLSDEELEKIRKETGWMPALTKEQYFDLKAQGKSDAQVCKEFGIDSNKLYALKKQWNAIGKFRAGKKIVGNVEDVVVSSSQDGKGTVIAEQIIEETEKHFTENKSPVKNATMGQDEQDQTDAKTFVFVDNPILKEVYELLIGQTKKGIEKYGTTVNPIDFSLSEWIDHVLQEKIDEIVYLVTIKHKIKSIL